MDAAVKGGGRVVVGMGGHGGGCWGGATSAAATTTVTLRCAGRDRRTVSGRELPRTRVASWYRIEAARVLRRRAGRPAPVGPGRGGQAAVAAWRWGWLVISAQRNATSSRAIATLTTVERLPRPMRSWWRR